jgi:hypothetical protein
VAQKRQEDVDEAPDAETSVAELLTELLRRTHLSAPSELARVIADQGRSIGAHDVELYLTDYEQEHLMPLRTAGGGERRPLSVAGTVAGRAYSSTTILESSGGDDGERRFWFPLLDGTDRLGAMGMSFAGPVTPQTIAACERYAHLAATLIITKGAYGDVFEVTRRRERMTIASELLWSLTPPLVFATDGLVIAGMLEPCYDNGGDTLDYALDDGVLHVAIFDSMGHGLAAAGLAAFAIAAYRHSRRHGLGLLETYKAMDAAITEEYRGQRFATAVIAQLDVPTGHLRWVNAGHPPPLVIRDGRRARMLSAPPATPLGVALGSRPDVAEESLEPGDMLLLYSDGLTEARRPDGELLGIDGLTEFIEHEAAARQPAPETLRRLRNAIVAKHDDRLRDDATALLIEWNRGTEGALLPPTVEGPRG